MKITYEEAMRSFNNSYSQNVRVGLIKKRTGRKTMLEKYLEQHKPPTFDDVVKCWEDIDYTVSVNYDNEKEITSVMENGTGPRKYFSFIFKNCVAFGQFVNDLTKEELSAINKTIEYRTTFQKAREKEES